MTDGVRQIADAVLYEGHVLWPYRRSALKNRQRWTFGGIYPAAYAEAHGDRSTVRAEFLVEGAAPRMEVEVRFLQVVRRQVVDAGVPVASLEAGGRRYLSWDEARERTVGPGGFRIPAGRADEPPYVRSWEELQGRVELRTATLSPGLRRVSLEITNTSPWAGGARRRDAAHAGVGACRRSRSGRRLPVHGGSA
jgi:hypothetical protein